MAGLGVVAGNPVRVGGDLVAELTHRLKTLWADCLLVLYSDLFWRLVLIALTFLVGNRDYLGLGVTSPNPEAVTIVSCFQSGGADCWSWLLKLVFTAVTVSSGFKGGEVTPLFFMVQPLFRICRYSWLAH